MSTQKQKNSEPIAIENALKQAARAAMSRAYAPYSKFKVGAAILADDGHIYSGVNVENIAYPQGVCAEASAISAMILGGGKHIQALAVIAQSKTPVRPCGGCRQKIAEFIGKYDPIVIMLSAEGSERSLLFSQLFPEIFDDLST